MVLMESVQSPQEFLQDLKFDGSRCITVTSDRLSWSFYFDYGKIAYAHCSLESFERLERHLRSLKREAPNLTDQVRSQLRSMFGDAASLGESESGVNLEYLAICWLVQEQYLTKAMARKMIARIVQEVLETFLCLPRDIFAMKHRAISLPEIYCSVETKQLIDIVTERLKSWRALGPTIFSPFQCPYLVTQTQEISGVSSENVQRLGRILKGFNFRQLGALMGRDDLAIAKQLAPLIHQRSVLLRGPLAPYDILPHTYHQGTEIETLWEPETESDDTISQIFIKQEIKSWKVACIDDSHAMLNEIHRFLGSEEFKVTLIDDSVKALMKLSTIRPDLILLDVGMPNVDGYQLCALIRKSSVLKEIPIVMVTGNKGLIDRARARLAGATDYLTKPFAQADLLKIVMRYLL
jgi:two-component system, chemotaxis family, response regulator PixG